MLISHADGYKQTPMIQKMSYCVQDTNFSGYIYFLIQKVRHTEIINHKISFLGEV